MRKSIILLLSVLLLISCNANLNRNLEVRAVDQYNQIKGNPFLSAVSRSDSSQSGDFSFILVSDTHIGKKDGVRVDDKFASWLEENGKSMDISFIVNLGDITDNSEPSQFSAFTEDVLPGWQASADTELFIPVLGNHDNRMDGPSLFMDSFGFSNTYYRFDYGEVEFYILDSSFRTLGRQQLVLFREAMEKADKDKPKIILSHIPLHGDSNVIYAAMTDSAEIRSIIQAMRQGGAKVYLTGHQHKGEIQHEYKAVNPSESINELIASCFFGGTIRNFTPRFYICHYRSAERMLVIDVYSYEGNGYTEEAEKYSFPL